VALLVADGVEKVWGGRAILRGVDLVVDRGEVVGLVGPNGSGKSSLLAILAGDTPPDGGTVLRSVTAGVLAQVPVLPGATVGESARLALGWHTALLARWEAAIAAGDTQDTAVLQATLDQVGWDLSHQVEAILDRLKCPAADADVSRLSGGEIRRVALARALLSSTDLLLLDEPTNHLDAETVEWLQDWIGAFRGAVVLVTHDRYLLEAVATRIVEIEDGIGVPYEGSYGDYLVERAERQEALHRAEDSRLAMITREAAWAARSPAARTTKQKARLQRLAALEARRPIKREETFSLDLRTGVKFGRTFLETRGLAKGFGGRRLIAGLDLDIGPGDRVGLVGPNGAGKSTLLGILAGTVQPDRGTVQRGPRVTVAVLDQHRTGLDPASTVFEAAGDGNTHVTVGDEPVHVAGFLRRFLFQRDQLEQRVAGLSGGERARLLLARLLLRGANLLLLDEPTNDLDLLTLGVLEEALLAFDGATVVVTHDRAFLDRVCNRVLAFEGDGRITAYADRLQAQAARRAAAVRSTAGATPAPAPASTAGPAPRARERLSWKEARELEALPARIEVLEHQRDGLAAQVSDPATWRDPASGAAASAALADVEREIAAAWSRWEALYQIASASADIASRTSARPAALPAANTRSGDSAPPCPPERGGNVSGPSKSTVARCTFGSGSRVRISPGGRDALIGGPTSPGWRIRVGSATGDPPSRPAPADQPRCGRAIPHVHASSSAW
jgi:ATP-binding cassette subfamily F protein uup